MSFTPQSQIRTRMFTRVVGPYLVIGPVTVGCSARLAHA